MKKFIFTIIIILNQTHIFSQENMTQTNESIKHPLLESCVEKSNDKKRIRCTEEKIINHITRNINKENIPSVLSEVKVMIKFRIKTNGDISDIQLLRSTCTNNLFKDDLIRVFGTLPRFHTSGAEEWNENQYFIIPMNIIIKPETDPRDLPRYNTRSPHNSYN